MRETVFVVYGEPQGKARPRFTITGRTYTPRKTVDYEREIRDAFQLADGVITEFPVSVSITALYKIPKSASKAKSAAMNAGEIMPTKKPDLDNIAKCVCDALNGIAYKDDAQICVLSVRKLYSTEPHIEVKISEIIF